MIQRLKGILVALLDEEELELFEAAIKAGWAYRDYDHVGGMFGLARVGIR